MQQNLTLSLKRRWAKLWLLVSIHLSAFWLAPKEYLTALKWRILGKRVRARSHFARLLNNTTRAYNLWALREAWESDRKPAACTFPPIIALVTAESQGQALDKTLASLTAEGIETITLFKKQPSLVADCVAAIDWQTGPWLLPMQVGDLIAPGAADSYRAAIKATEASLIYADDDLIDARSRRRKPHLKPDWNEELYRHHDYLTGSCILKASANDLALVDGHFDWDKRLVNLALAHGQGAHHIPRVLHHRTNRPDPPVKPQPLAIARDLPTVSVIVPTRNRLDLLKTCLSGIAATNYPDIEVIVVDNDSDDPETLAFLAAQDPARIRVLRHAGRFNYSAINNRAVAEARGRLLCLLNNDIEVVSPDWLSIMATQALRKEVGAVGAQLLYPDGRIQHAGVVIGMGDAAGHAHRFINPKAEGYFRRHGLPQFASAVTAACLVVQRDRFLAVGGLDERNFAVAFNDVDLCLRLNQRGWQSLYEPRAVLIHHESVSRGFDRDPVGAARFAGELAALQHIWHTRSACDPFHNPNLSRASEQFVLSL